MLVNGGVRYGGGPMRTLGGVAAGAIDRISWEQRGATLNMFAGEATVINGVSIANKNGIPSGYLQPASWSLPIKAGGMSTRNRGLITSSMTASMQAALPMQASGSATSLMEATASLIVSMLAEATAASSMTASAVGVASIAAESSASAAFTAASSALAGMSATSAASLTTSAFLTALANMEAATGGDTLSADVIATAVWAHGSGTQVSTDTTLVRRILDNRLEVDITGQRLVLYADDGTTELREWPLDTDGGESVATAIGVQTKRGAPT